MNSISKIVLCSVLLFSCERGPQPVLFAVRGTEQALFGLCHDAVEGKLDFSKPKKLEYQFAAAPLAPGGEPASFEIVYSLIGIPAMAGIQFAVELDGRSWVLPNAVDGTVFHYAIPCAHNTENLFPGNFSIASTGAASKDSPPVKNSPAHLQIHSIEFTRRWFGFYRQQDANRLHLSPFVSRQPGETTAWVIDPPAEFRVTAGFFPVLSAELQPGNEAIVNAGSYRLSALPHLERLTVPSAFISGPDPLIVTGDRTASFYLAHNASIPFPEPITADPGMILSWPQNTWRDRRYEIFRWESFPSLLFIDYADYAIQARMLKRLAFFVEKAGFRGRMASDEEIAPLHGWNAHNYRAYDLARFFQTARDLRFPLLAEERELESILLKTGIILETANGLEEGEGAILSLSRESPDYLRFTFMAHEGFHGLYFIDEDFRTFSRQRWQQFNAEAKRFIISFFSFQQYDVSYEYLLINEFMGFILQQSVSQAGRYFGQTLPSRLENTWRRSDLPAKDEASGTWPTLAAAFTREAEAFSAYVNRRWGLSAGRIHSVTVRHN